MTEIVEIVIGLSWFGASICLMHYLIDIDEH